MSEQQPAQAGVDDRFIALHVSIADHVANVVLRGPGKGNALGPDFWREMPLLFDELDRNEEVRAIVLSGAGGNFTFGLDLAGMRAELRYALSGENLALERTRLLDQISAIQRATTSVMSCRKPVIAAISGWCIGAGIDLACTADIRLCSADAHFSVRAVRVGIVEDAGSLQLLPRIVGEGIARELALTGSDFGAEYARDVRFVSRVLASTEELMRDASSVARRIASNPPLVVQGVKQVMNESAYRGVAESMRFNALWNAAFLQSHDFAEAVAAFAERREPKFEGR